METGKSAQEILDMPFSYVVDILAEKNKPKEVQSLIAAFGG
ncbi:phage tail assembly chaperone GT [Halobacillus sp. BBL2006]